MIGTVVSLACSECGAPSGGKPMCDPCLQENMKAMDSDLDHAMAVSALPHAAADAFLFDGGES